MCNKDKVFWSMFVYIMAFAFFVAIVFFLIRFIFQPYQVGQTIKNELFVLLPIFIGMVISFICVKQSKAS